LGPVSHRDGVLLGLRDDSGSIGYGEATPLEAFGSESLDAASASLERCAALLKGATLDEPAEAIGWLEQREAPTPTARAAIDSALHDLVAQAAGRSLASWLAAREGIRARSFVGVNALLAARDATALAVEAARAVASGFGTLKLKIGVGPASDDFERISAVRRAVGTAPRIRADANGAWSPDEACKRLEILSEFQLEFVEQPVTARDVTGLARVRRASPVPVAADESVLCEPDLRRVLDADAADVVILKPSVFGGIGRARAAAELTRAAGVRVVLTSFLDGAVAVLGALHLAASLPGDLDDCGLATSALLENDLAPVPAPERGRLPVPSATGLGAAVASCRRGRAA
jgi:o-succinylbenzoate synthase